MRTTARVLLALATCVAAAGPAPASAAPAYVITNLGTLGGVSVAQDVAVTAGGTVYVVGWSTDSGRTRLPFVWSSQTRRMQQLPLPQGHTSGDAYAVAADGRIVGEATGCTGGSCAQSHAVVWRVGSSGTPVVERLLGPDRVASGLSPDGRYAVGYDYGETSSGPRRWDLTSGVETVLAGVDAQDVTADGVVVGAVRSGTSIVAARWAADGTLTELPPLAGRSESSAVAINATGVVVGQSRDQYHAARAVMWTGTSPVQLVTPAAPKNRTTASWASDISASGHIVGTLNSRAALWTTPGSVVDLNSYLGKASGWVLERANGISDRGHIVGQGAYKVRNVAFLLTPTS